MKLFGYIDDGVNWLIVNAFEKLPILVNVIIFVMIIAIIFMLWDLEWGRR